MCSVEEHLNYMFKGTKTHVSKMFKSHTLTQQ